LHTAYFLQQYNGNPELQKLFVELADGLLAKRDSDGNFYTDINFSTGEVRGRTGLQGTWQVMYAAYVASGNKRYLEPIRNRLEQSNLFEEKAIEKRYIEKIKDLGTQEFINTEGSVWIDRVAADFNDLQTDRLGGVAISRIQNIYPQNYVSWNMKQPATFKSLATFVLSADSSKIKILAFNLEKGRVESALSVWKIKPGKWRIRQGIDTDNDQIPDRGNEIELSFASYENTIVELELIEPSASVPWKLPDLAINRKSIKINKDLVTVRVYNQGAVVSPEAIIELWDFSGEKVNSFVIPPIEAPLDLVPKWTEVKIAIPQGTNLNKGCVTIDPEEKIIQITRKNTIVVW
jgi:hypothetical protein